VSSPTLTDTTALLDNLYIYDVSAIDNKGHMGPTAPVTDGPCDAPGAPGTLIVTAGSQEVLVDWQAPASVAGSLPVSEYIVTVNGTPVTLPASQTSYLVNNNGLGLTDPAGVTVSIQDVDASGLTTGNHASTVLGPVTVTTNKNNLNPPTGLSALAKGPNSVSLTWTQPNNLGYFVGSFILYRSNSFNGTYSQIATIVNPPLTPASSYTDNSAPPNTTNYYLLKAVYTNPVGTSPNSNHALAITPALSTPVPPVSVSQMAFDANVLKPLTGQVLGIYFVSPNSGPVELIVYDIAGHPIRSLYPPAATAGVEESLTWDGKDRNGNTVASGLYLIEIRANGFHEIKKVIVVK
jgi:hypothetical protein